MKTLTWKHTSISMVPRLTHQYANPQSMGWAGGYITRQRSYDLRITSWWRHDKETLSILLSLCERNPPVITMGQWRRLCYFLWVGLKERLKKPSVCWWFETPWRRRDVTVTIQYIPIIMQWLVFCYGLVWFSTIRFFMMTSSSGVGFRVTGLLLEESIGHRQ